MKIRSKLFISYTAIVLTTILFFGLLMFFNVKSNIEQLEIQKLEIAAELKVRAINDYFGHFIRDTKAEAYSLNILDNFPLLIQHKNDTKNPAYLTALDNLNFHYSKYIENENLIDFMLLDNSGNVIYSAAEEHREIETNKNLSVLFEVNMDAISKGETWISNPFRYEGKIEVIITRPIISRTDNKQIGFLAIEVNMENIFSILKERTGLGSTGETIIGMRNGDYALFISPILHGKDSELTYRLPLSKLKEVPMLRAVNEKEGSGIETDYAGKEVIAVWRYLPMLKWGLVAKINTLESFAAVTTTRNYMIWIAGAMLFLSLIAAYIISRTISIPIRILQKSAELVGRAKFDTLTGVKSNDEIGLLSKSFDDMVLNLKETTASRNELNIALENIEKNRKNMIKAQAIANVGSFEWDIVNDKVYSSDEFYRIFGLHPDKIWSYQNLLQCIDPQDINIFKNAVDDSISNKTPYTAEYRIVLPDGKIRSIQAKGAITTDINGIPVKMIGTVQDITERKRQELELIAARNLAQSANRAKSEFIANMNHELRTPMNAILGFPQILLREHCGKLNEYQKEALKDILTSSENLLTIIDSILDFSKIEAGKMELDISNVKIGALLEKMNLLFREKAAAHSINLEFKISPDLPEIWEVDEAKLSQIIINLLSNAFKFTPANGNVILEAVMDSGSCAMISVTNNGPVISKEDQQKLFSPFERLQSNKGGTGLGLALCKSITALWNGQISIVSPPEGKETGCRFYFTIPLKKR